VSQSSNSSASAAHRARSRHGAFAGRPPALLTMPGFHGTLAAVRNLGRNGVPVTTADPSRFTGASWSKYTTKSVRCPPIRETDRFLSWLMAFGKRSERHVLLPTCDDTAFLYSLHRERLAEHFYSAVPGVDVMQALLNKRLLMEHARAVGLATPRSWTPGSVEEVATLAREVRFPLLIKPTTQVLFDPRVKGTKVARPEELVPAYERLAQDSYGQALRDHDPSVTRPLIQEFFPDAAESGIYSICGHVRDGQIVGARASRKVLQWPRPLGIGVCFEAAAVQPELREALSRLMTRVGFSGTFEAEFVQDGERRLLIDVNPRFYGQMGFDVARGLPLPLLAYQDAVAEPLAPAAFEESTGATNLRVYAHGAALKVLLHAQHLTGALSAQEKEKWLRFYNERPRVDAVVDCDDPRPAFFDKLNIARDLGRHPLRFVNVIAHNG
jgi:D-aspartate ligase